MEYYYNRKRRDAVSYLPRAVNAVSIDLKGHITTHCMQLYHTGLS